MTDKPVSLALPLLQALILVGDERAIREVEFVAKGTNGEVRQSAVELLSVLHRRAEESKASAQLLRASVAPAENGQTLLRAAREQAGTDPAQLLRIARGPMQEEQP